MASRFNSILIQCPDGLRRKKAKCFTYEILLKHTNLRSLSVPSLSSSHLKEEERLLFRY